MRKTPTVRALEAARGQPIEHIIADTYNRAGSIRAAAAELGVPADTFYGWMVRLGIRINVRSSVTLPSAVA